MLRQLCLLEHLQRRYTMIAFTLSGAQFLVDDTKGSVIHVKPKATATWVNSNGTSGGLTALVDMFVKVMVNGEVVDLARCSNFHRYC